MKTPLLKSHLSFFRSFFSGPCNTQLASIPQPQEINAECSHILGVGLREILDGLNTSYSICPEIISNPGQKTNLILIPVTVLHPPVHHTLESHRHLLFIFFFGNLLFLTILFGFFAIFFDFCSSNEQVETQRFSTECPSREPAQG